MRSIYTTELPSICGFASILEINIYCTFFSPVSYIPTWYICVVYPYHIHYSFPVNLGHYFASLLNLLTNFVLQAFSIKIVSSILIIPIIFRFIGSSHKSAYLSFFSFLCFVFVYHWSYLITFSPDWDCHNVSCRFSL